MQLRIRTLSRMLSAILLTMALVFGGSVALADDDDDDNSAQGEPTAYLYEGSTADLESAVVVDEIDDLDKDDDDDDNDWDKLGNGQPRPDGLLSTEDDLDDDLRLTVETLVDGDYMIVVHAGESTDSPVLVAGDIEGDIQAGTILIELDEIDGSGYEGRSFIHPDDDDDDDDDDENELEVTVGIYPTGSVEPLDTATPAAN